MVGKEVILFGSNGTTLERYEYDAYGKCYFWNAALSDLLGTQKSGHDNPYLFTGRRLDILETDGSLEI